MPKTMPYNCDPGAFTGLLEGKNYWRLLAKWEQVLTNNQDIAKIEPMAQKQPKLTDQLRAAIAASDKTMGQIARESGIDIATISRFMHGKGGLSVDGLDRIAECLGLNLTAGKPRPKKGSR